MPAGRPTLERTTPCPDHAAQNLGPFTTLGSALDGCQRRTQRYRPRPDKGASTAASASETVKENGGGSHNLNPTRDADKPPETQSARQKDGAGVARAGGAPWTTLSGAKGQDSARLGTRARRGEREPTGRGEARLPARTLNSSFTQRRPSHGRPAGMPESATGPHSFRASSRDGQPHPGRSASRHSHPSRGRPAL